MKKLGYVVLFYAAWNLIFLIAWLVVALLTWNLDTFFSGESWCIYWQITHIIPTISVLLLGVPFSLFAISVWLVCALRGECSKYFGGNQ